MEIYKDLIEFVDIIEYDMTNISALYKTIQKCLDQWEADRFDLTWKRWKIRNKAVQQLQTTINIQTEEVLKHFFFF